MGLLLFCSSIRVFFSNSLIPQYLAKQLRELLCQVLKIRVFQDVTMKNYFFPSFQFFIRAFISK